MTEKKYSEDYEKLLFYKQSLLSENFAEIKKKTVNFFFKKYKEHFYSNLEVHEKKTQHLINDLLISFINYKFKQLFYELNELRIINNMSRDEIYSNITSDKEEEDLLFQISYLRLEYNIVLTQAKMNQVDYEKNSENANVFSPGKIRITTYRHKDFLILIKRSSVRAPLTRSRLVISTS